MCCMLYTFVIYYMYTYTCIDYIREFKRVRLGHQSYNMQHITYNIQHITYKMQHATCIIYNMWHIACNIYNIWHITKGGGIGVRHSGVNWFKTLWRLCQDYWCRQGYNTRYGNKFTRGYPAPSIMCLLVALFKCIHICIIEIQYLHSWNALVKLFALFALLKAWALGNLGLLRAGGTSWRMSGEPPRATYINSPLRLE